MQGGEYFRNSRKFVVWVFELHELHCNSIKENCIFCINNIYLYNKIIILTNFTVSMIIFINSNSYNYYKFLG